MKDDKIEVAIKIMLKTNLYSDFEEKIKLFSCCFIISKRLQKVTNAPFGKKG